MKRLIPFFLALILGFSGWAQDEPQPFALVDQAPIYLGCEGDNAALKTCLSQKIAQFIGENYNQEYAESLGIAPGRYKMYARFTIDTKGDFSNITVEGEHIALNEELKRVIDSFPKVIPGMIDDKPVDVMYALPVMIQLNDDPTKNRKKKKRKNKS